MEKILVSACLLGQPVRYDARAATVNSDILDTWSREGRLVPICPETAGGLPVPRPPAEIQGGRRELVLLGRARVVTDQGADVTEHFRSGAEQALELAQRHGIRMAVLKERSPSCGSLQIYDGTFTGTRKAGEGVTAALLRSHGIRVFSEERLEEAQAYLASLEPPA